MYRTDLFPLIEVKNLTDKLNLSGPTDNDSNYTINHFLILHDPLDNIPLSKLETENIFLPNTEKLTLELLQKKTKILTQSLDKTLLRCFRKFNNTSINENTNILEYQTSEFKVPCLPLSLVLIAFHTSHSLNPKGQAGSEKKYSNYFQNFCFPSAPIRIKVLRNDCITCQLNKPYPHQSK